MFPLHSNLESQAASLSISSGSPLMHGGRINKKNVKKKCKNGRKNITEIVGTNRSGLTAVHGSNAHVLAANGTKSHGSGLISGQSLSDWGQIMFL